MEKEWEDMTVDEKLDALRSENADQIKTDLRLSSGIDDLALQTTAFFAIIGAMSENGLPQVDRVEAWCERLRLVSSGLNEELLKKKTQELLDVVGSLLTPGQI
jgi:hypothetical protein